MDENRAHNWVRHGLHFDQSPGSAMELYRRTLGILDDEANPG